MLHFEKILNLQSKKFTGVFRRQSGFGDKKSIYSTILIYNIKNWWHCFSVAIAFASRLKKTKKKAKKQQSTHIFTVSAGRKAQIETFTPWESYQKSLLNWEVNEIMIYRNTGLNNCFFCKTAKTKINRIKVWKAWKFFQAGELFLLGVKTFGICIRASFLPEQRAQGPVWNPCLSQDYPWFLLVTRCVLTQQHLKWSLNCFSHL